MAKKDVIEIEVLRQSKKTTHNKTTKGVRNHAKKFHSKQKKVQTAFEKKAQKVFEERAEARRLVSLANKRLRRLEAKGYTNSPAYKATNGYFSVRGRNQAEIQSLIRNMNKFINAATSTIRGTNRHVKELAKTTGVKYKDMKDLQRKIPKFFELSNKVTEYLRTAEDMASAIDYHQIWEQVNVYVKDNSIDLSKAEGDIDGMIKHISDALKKYEETNTVAGTTFRLKK